MPSQKKLWFVGLCGFLALVLSGCGTPPWQEPTGVPTETPVSAPPSAPVSSATPRKNDLAKGKLTRTLTAGAIQLSVTYWSDLAMDEWTPEATKPLSLSLSGSFADEQKQDIYLGRVTISVDVLGSQGKVESLDPIVDQADASPGYLIKAPSSYSQVFTFAELPPEATSLTVNIVYELQMPTAPQAKTFTKQSAHDTLVIALA